MSVSTNPLPPVSEPPATLRDGEVPRTLSVLDQTAFWANLGVSLLGPITALSLLLPIAGGPRLSVVAAFTALVVGSVIGAAMVGLAAVPGAETGAPAMVLLRGLFGTRLSYLPTVLNILQLIGWAVFELVVIAAAAQLLVPGSPRWLYVLLGGVITTALAIRPLGFIKAVRKYVLVAVVIASLYLLVQLLRAPLPSLTKGTWSGFFTATDFAVALSVSWVPLAADYSRHARSPRGCFSATTIGYAFTQIGYVTLGLIAFSTVVATDAQDPQSDIFRAFIAVPLGALAFAVLIIRELDQSFANVYSTAASTQNLLPRVDRRLLAIVVGVAATGLALAVRIDDYASFLSLIGSVFVPLTAVLATDYFLLGGRGRWNVADESAPRPIALLPWALGVVVYQLINPGGVGWWSQLWNSIDTHLHITVAPWMSASMLSFAAAALATLACGRWMRASAGRS